MSDVANVILQQLGGRMFLAMTGAKNLSSNGNDLVFGLPGGGGFTKQGINKVKVVLNGADLYDVTYYKIRKMEVKVIAESFDLFFDQLQSDFKEKTGLNTSL